MLFGDGPIGVKLGENPLKATGVCRVYVTEVKESSGRGFVHPPGCIGSTQRRCTSVWQERGVVHQPECAGFVLQRKQYFRERSRKSTGVCRVYVTRVKRVRAEKLHTAHGGSTVVYIAKVLFLCGFLFRRTRTPLRHSLLSFRQRLPMMGC